MGIPPGHLFQQSVSYNPHISIFVSKGQHLRVGFEDVLETCSSNTQKEKENSRLRANHRESSLLQNRL